MAVDKYLSSPSFSQAADFEEAPELRRHPASSPSDSADTCIPQPSAQKKRHTTAHDDTAPSPKIGKLTAEDYIETPNIFFGVPALTRNDVLEYTVRDESAIFAFDDVWVAVPIEGQRVPVENINDVMNEPHTVDTDSEFEDPRSESLSVGKSFMSMEEFGRYILEEEVPVLNTVGISREEQFGYILEEFLKQHDYLPPELTDNLFEMLEDIKESIAKQKNNSKEEKHEIDLTGEGGDNEKSLVVSDRSDDGDESGEETEVPADDTDEKAGLVESERPANADIYLEDLWMSDDGDICLEEIEGPADDESVVGSDETDEEEEDCLAIDHPGFRFPKIKDIDVVMVSTGEKIYNDIAGFFGYDGYVDYLTYQESSDIGVHRHGGQ